jgi:hypothetical protein
LESRVTVAICLEPHEAVSVGAGEGGARRETRRVTEDPSWLKGPPFAVVEQVFDEYSLEDGAVTKAEPEVMGPTPA